MQKPRSTQHARSDGAETAKRPRCWFDEARAKQSHGSRRFGLVRHASLGNGRNEVPQTCEVSSSHKRSDMRDRD